VSSPRFPKLDPGDPAFWDVRYGASYAPWEKGGVPRQLAAFVAHSLPQGVLVPGCGSAHDVRLFAEAGWEVVGIDFSPEAIAAARPVLGPWSDRVRLHDFFEPIPEEPFPTVYERAFLCALPRRLWSAWGRRVAQLVAPGGVLAGFFFFGDGEHGPPYPLHGTGELAALLDPAFERVEDAPVEDSIAVFAGRERWQLWRRRPDTPARPR